MNRIKKTFTLLFMLGSAMFSFDSSAQNPSWQWARSAGGHGEDMGESIVTDDSGYVYVTGSYTSPTITFGTITLTNAGGTTADMFIVKYAPSGNVVWAKTIGGIDGEIGHGIAADASGNVYVTGWFSGAQVTFGGTTLINAAAGSTDMFVAKYNASGNAVWAKSAGGTGTDVGYGIAVDGPGNVYVAGMFFSPTVLFGSTTLTNAGGGGSDIFIVRYDVSGNVSWAKCAGGAGPDLGYSVAADGNGDAFLTGWFGSTSVTFGTNTLANSGSGYNMFLVKYSSAGNVSWAKSAGGTGNENGNSVAVDASNNVFLTGLFDSPAISFGTTVLTNQGYSDCFTVKYDGSGNVLWAKSAGGAYDDAGMSASVSSAGDVYISGRFASTTLTFGTTVLTNVAAGANDLFVARLDGSGNAQWALCAGGSYDDISSAAAADLNGNVFLTGKFNSPGITFGSTVLYKSCGNDFLIAALGNAVGIQENDLSEPVTVFPNPSKGMFSINDAGSVVRKLEVYNTYGEKVFMCPQPSSGLVIDLTGYPPGMYFISVTVEGGNVVQRKVILQ